MSLFSAKSDLILKKASDIENILTVISAKPHVVLSSILGENVTSKIYKCSQFLYLYQFNPVKPNQDLRPGTTYKFNIEAVVNSERFDIFFESKFVQSDVSSARKYIEFSLPDQLKYKKSNYEVYPKAEDNIILTFKMKNLPEFRKVIYLDIKEIHFSGELDYLLADYNGRTIYNIELKLPFEKLIISGNFKKIRKECFAFENYIYTSSTKEMIEKYFEYDFIRNNSNMEYQVENYDNPLPDISYQIMNSEKKYIIIYDEKKIVTEYITEYLSKRISSKIVQINDFHFLPDTISQFPPKLIILNELFGSENIKEYAQTVTKYPCPIIITKSAGSSLRGDEISEIKVKGVINKPVEGKQLLDMIKKILGEDL